MTFADQSAIEHGSSSINSRQAQKRRHIGIAGDSGEPAAPVPVC